MLVYTAAHLFPVASAPIADGAVGIDGDRIVAVGGREDLLSRAGNDAEVRSLGDCVVLPGLVNAHCHVELSWMGEDPPPGGDYLVWLRGLLERRGREDPKRCQEAARRAIDGMVAGGTVALADVTNQGWIAPLLARSTLRGVIFHEIYGPRAGDAERLVREAVRQLEAATENAEFRAAGDRWRFVLAPHAPHTTSEPLLRALGGRSKAARDPLSIHVSESEAEVTLLRDASGPFPDLFRERNVWDEAWRAPGRTPIEYLDRLGLLSPQTLAVHCVHLVRGDISRLQAKGAHVVTCPRSNARLGVGRAPVGDLLGQGIPVALGTDSLASSPDLDLFAEMAALLTEHPGLPPAAVLRMATQNGARALGLADDLGSIEPGKLARLLVVPLESSEDDDPLRAICSVPPVVHHLDRAPYTEIS